MHECAEALDLSDVVRDALGAGRRIVGTDRLRGGTTKGVYRVRLGGTGPASVIVYRWAQEESFWPGGVEDDAADPFAPASGLAPFLAAQRALDGLGVRVPRVLWADGGGKRGEGDVAVVEDVTGGTLESLLETDPARGAAALDDVARALDLMHRHRAPPLRQSGSAGGRRRRPGEHMRAAGSRPGPARPRGDGGPRRQDRNGP
ncbi:phosphotransferase [Streptomyces sp. NPDC051907]|uniref:phosphotransferase n=1 Tax=Streptomyces sp. NPDC051907 TaxID=3155284 RepID=UPI003448AED1